MYTTGWGGGGGGLERRGFFGGDLEFVFFLRQKRGKVKFLKARRGDTGTNCFRRH